MRNDSSIQSNEDVRLMLKVKRGDQRAYALLYEKYSPVVRRYVAGRNGRTQSPDDVAQEVFTRVWRRRSQYQPLAPVKSYLLGVAANVLRESWVKVHSRASVDMRSLQAAAGTRRPSPLSQAQSSEQLQAVRTLMMRLPTRQRQAVELVYLAGLSPHETAQRLGCSVKTVRVHLCLACRRLRDLARLFP